MQVVHVTRGRQCTRASFQLQAVILSLLALFVVGASSDRVDDYATSLPEEQLVSLLNDAGVDHSDCTGAAELRAKALGSEACREMLWHRAHASDGVVCDGDVCTLPESAAEDGSDFQIFDLDENGNVKQRAEGADSEGEGEGEGKRDAEEESQGEGESEGESNEEGEAGRTKATPETDEAGAAQDASVEREGSTQREGDAMPKGAATAGSAAVEGGASVEPKPEDEEAGASEKAEAAKEAGEETADAGRTTEADGRAEAETEIKAESEEEAQTEGQAGAEGKGGKEGGAEAKEAGDAEAKEEGDAEAKEEGDAEATAAEKAESGDEQVEEADAVKGSSDAVATESTVKKAYTEQDMLADLSVVQVTAQLGLLGAMMDALVNVTFGLADTDLDGTISRSEASAFAKAHLRKTSPFGQTLGLRGGQGELAEAAVSAGVERVFSACDADKSGGIDKDEAKQCRRQLYAMLEELVAEDAQNAAGAQPNAAGASGWEEFLQSMGRSPGGGRGAVSGGGGGGGGGGRSRSAVSALAPLLRPLRRQWQQFRSRVVQNLQRPNFNTFLGALGVFSLLLREALALDLLNLRVRLQDIIGGSLPEFQLRLLVVALFAALAAAFGRFDGM